MVLELINSTADSTADLDLVGFLSLCLILFNLELLSVSKILGARVSSVVVVGAAVVVVVVSDDVVAVVVSVVVVVVVVVVVLAS